MFRNLENLAPFNILSRVTIVVAKYPSDATLSDYGALQSWMYTHANKRASVDICQSLSRMFLIHTDRYDNHIRFNLHLICAEAYQTVGDIGQAYGQYNEAGLVANILDNRITTLNTYEVIEKNRKRKKLDEIKMKLKFQTEFYSILFEDPKQQRFSKFLPI